MKKIAYLLNHPNDIALASIFYKTKPEDVQVKIIMTNFFAMDKYSWGSRVGKSKSLDPCIRPSDYDDIKEIYPEGDIIICKSEQEFINETTSGKYDICVSRGRELFVFPEWADKTIALSMNRCYFNRLLDVFPFYKNLNVFLYSDEWKKESSCGNFCMDPRNSYDQVNENIDKIHGVDIFYHNFEILKEKYPNRIDARSDLGLPEDKKIALLSFRMAESSFSIYRNLSEFLEKTEKMINDFRDRGYYIVSRERTDSANITWDRSRGFHGQIDKFNNLIDRKINDHGGFPSVPWRLCYTSDVMLLSDTSGLATNEGVGCRTPIFMPKVDRDFSQIFPKDHPINPVQRGLFESGLIFDDPDELDELGIKEYRNSIEDFISRWYNTDVNKFWNEILR